MKDNKKLLDILQEIETKRELEERLLETTDSELLYHFSEVRENILNWYPFEGKESFLEIGAECGALTGMLCEKVAHVVALETDALMNEVNQKRNSQSSNLEIVEKKIENLGQRKFDYISLIGTLERYHDYSDVMDEREFLKRVKSLLMEQGTLFLAIDNKFALKHWAGCKDDISDDSLVKFDKGYSYRDINELLKDAGYTEIEFLFPNPDYEFPMEIFNEERVPESGFLTNPLASYFSERMVAFDEVNAMDAVCKDGRFKEFANSYLIMCR